MTSPAPGRRALAVEFAVVLAVVWAPLLAASLYGRTARAPRSWTSTLFQITVECGQAILILYLLWRNGESWRHLGIRKVRWWSEILWGGFIYAACWLAWLAVEQWIPGAGEAAPARRHGSTATAILCVTILIGACFEEIFVRGYLWDRLVRLTGNKPLSLVASSALFTAYHPYAPRDLLDVFLFGLVLGAFRWMGRSLPRLILAHVLYNLAITFRWD